MTKGRICVLCHRRLYNGLYISYEFSIALKALGIEGMWAHPNCVVAAVKMRKGLRKLTLAQAQEDDHD